MRKVAVYLVTLSPQVGFCTTTRYWIDNVPTTMTHVDNGWCTEALQNHVVKHVELPMNTGQLGFRFFTGISTHLFKCYSYKMSTKIIICVGFWRKEFKKCKEELLKRVMSSHFVVIYLRKRRVLFKETFCCWRKTNKRETYAVRLPAALYFGG